MWELRKGAGIWFDAGPLKENKELLGQRNELVTGSSKNQKEPISVGRDRATEVSHSKTHFQ
jgi:hypothetical protein